MIERVGSLSLLRFDPSRLDVFAPSLGGNRSRPTTAQEALASGAVAVLDGPMFSRCDSAALSGTDAERYAQSQCSRVEYALLGSEVSVGSLYPSNGATFSIVEGRAVVLPDAQVAQGARVAVQTYPHIVRAGRNIANPEHDTDRTWRAALVLLDTKELAFAIMQASMHAFAAALVALGAVEAGYTDGGGSGRLETADGQRVGSSENRRVGSWLVVRAAEGAGGVGGGGLLLLGAALLGAAWLASRRRP